MFSWLFLYSYSLSSPFLFVFTLFKFTICLWCMKCVFIIYEQGHRFFISVYNYFILGTHVENYIYNIKTFSKYNIFFVWLIFSLIQNYKWNFTIYSMYTNITFIIIHPYTLSCTTTLSNYFECKQFFKYLLRVKRYGHIAKTVTLSFFGLVFSCTAHGYWKSLSDKYIRKKWSGLQNVKNLVLSFFLLS